MKDLLNEKPIDELCGRTFFSKGYVNKNDITNKKMLDIGCGFGWFEFNILKENPDLIVGLEPEQKNLETAKCFFQKKEITNVKFKVGSALKLPFPDNYFDTVVSWEVLEHLPKKTEELMFKEVYRVLKSNGVFYLSTPYNSFCKFFDPAWWLIGHRHYSIENLSSFAKKNGFNVKNIIVKGGWWELFSILNLYVSKWIFRRRPFFKDYFYKKLNREYNKQGGFMNLFVKLKKEYVE